MKYLILAAVAAILVLPVSQASAASAQNNTGVPVISGGKVIGQDPDPNVRMQILRDYGHENENP